MSSDCMNMELPREDCNVEDAARYEKTKMTFNPKNTVDIDEESSRVIILENAVSAVSEENHVVLCKARRLLHSSGRATRTC